MRPVQLSLAPRGASGLKYDKKIVEEKNERLAPRGASGLKYPAKNKVYGYGQRLAPRGASGLKYGITKVFRRD